MAQLRLSTKHLQISKANSRVVLFIAIAAFVTVFSLVSSRALLSKRSYQSRVIAGKEKAAKQLKDNLKAVSTLAASYAQFTNSSNQNVLGGTANGLGDKDGDNAKIVLDALPSKYDFPALASSLEKILNDRSYKVNSISGTDDELKQAQGAVANPVAIPIPFVVQVTGTYDSTKDLVLILERSVRPFQIQTLSFTGQDAAIKLNINANTYYQPGKNLDITTKEVK